MVKIIRQKTLTRKRMVLKTLGRLFMGRETVLNNFESVLFLKKNQRSKDQQHQKFKHQKQYKIQKSEEKNERKILL